MVLETSQKYTNYGLIIHGSVSVGTAWGGTLLIVV